MKTTWVFPPVKDLPVQDGMPDPFVKPDGSRVTSAEEWHAQREYLKAMLTQYMYGSMPPRPKHLYLKHSAREGNPLDIS
jgi:hypothetical protein